MYRKFLVGVSLAAQLVLATAVAGGVPAIAADEKPVKPHMDLAFCIDTTGSMQGEIDTVKAKVRELVAKLSSGNPAPLIRVGLVAYRDRGDEYVTRIFPFSDDIDRFVKDISNLRADGGGDGPEAVNQALHSAVHDLSWDASSKTAKLLFLIGDAGPNKYKDDYDWRTESKNAISRGIQINTIGCSGLEGYPAADGVDVFKQIAKLTDGKYDTLAYHQEVVTADGRKETMISSGGAVYRVKAEGKDAWKAGAAALAAGGKLEKTSSVAAASTRARSYGGLMAAPASLPAAGFAMAREADIGSGALSRRDNNLDEVLLQGARAAAKKSLNVEFSR